MTTTVNGVEPGLVGDFYNFEGLLSDEERKTLRNPRPSLRDEIKPLVNEAWAKAEFPFELIDKFATSGLGGLDYEGYGEHKPAATNMLSGMLAVGLGRLGPAVRG